jgi:hypothetical protein
MGNYYDVNGTEYRCDETGNRPKLLAQLLNQLGRDGWELVSSDAGSDGYLFKRPVEEAA